MRLIKEWEKTRTFARLLIALDDDDPTLDEYLDKLSAEHNDWLGIAVQPRMRLGGTLNQHAMAAVESRPYETSVSVLAQWTVDTDIVGFLGDDHVPRTHGFDARIKSAMDSMGGTGVVYGNDLIQGPNLPTAVAISSNIIQTLGYMVPIGQKHLYIDDFWLYIGRNIGKVSYLADVIIQHLHPVGGTAEWDDRYAEVNSGETYAQDLAVFEEWKRSNSVQELTKLRSLL